MITHLGYERLVTSWSGGDEGNTSSSSTFEAVRLVTLLSCSTLRCGIELSLVHFNLCRPEAQAKVLFDGSS